VIPWIQVYSNLIHHPKTTALADELGIRSADANPNAVAAGMLVSLWLWAAQNATDGDLSRCSDRAIAEAAEYKKKPSAFVSALLNTKWLDDNKKLHDWEQYASLLQDMNDRQKANTAARVRRLRERRKQESAVTVTPDVEEDVTQSEASPDGDSNGYSNVTVTLGNAPTLPNHTLPNNTLPVSNILPSTDDIEQVGSIGAAATHGQPYGTRGNVYLTESEYDRLLLNFGELNLITAIEQMGVWLQNTESPPCPEKHYEILRKKLWKDPLIRNGEP
jgi:hypothetical protein